MLKALSLLLTCQLVGEIITRGLALPLPGPVLGLLILVGLLFAFAQRVGVTPNTVDDSALGHVSNGLLGVMGILFVPAGVGVIQEMGPLSHYGLALALALVVSSVVTLVVTVWVFVLVSRLVERHDKSRG